MFVKRVKMFEREKETCNKSKHKWQEIYYRASIRCTLNALRIYYFINNTITYIFTIEDLKFICYGIMKNE